MRVILICLGLLGVVFGGEVTIRPGQTLNIGVTGVAVSEKGRLDNNYSVSKEGKVTMWKIGPVQAAGKTKAALAKEIAAAYRKAGIYENPVFQVFSDGGGEIWESEVVTIGGQVRAPGQTPWKKGMTLADALKMAGGLTPRGAEHRLRLYRMGKIYELNNGNGKARKIRIYPSDIIEVPDNKLFANANEGRAEKSNEADQTTKEAK